MTSGLFETIQRIVAQQLAGVRRSAVGIVQDQQALANGNYACTVALRNSQVVLKDVPIATGTLGYVAAPAIGETVLVEYIGSSPDEPVITGRLYSGENRPPPASAGTAVLRLPPGADDANAAQVAISGTDQEVTLTLGDDVKVSLRGGDPAVEVDVGKGPARTTLSIAPDGSVTLDARKLTLSADTVVDIRGQEITLSGLQLNLRADHGIALNSKGVVEVNGQIIKLN
ncbi:hypothetical protein [Cryptosporangium aurantiacum]|uniref:Gp5/Type VI secretion system Vgr protein OB-fold domain-containing protein n=1 Tax=Cryptosporangium aurantiacum TaxID=134849 RepID=A0A1M7RMQ2_9ACTN|nr:hypothetical protein [Cryptosporangium aurantiacum]SHN47382.1 hypothetical protein SAMN05443668_12328 [Cryptosporangium aurantiacum]